MLCSDYCFRALHVHETAEISGQATWNWQEIPDDQSGNFYLIYIFLLLLQNYTTVPKFIRFDHQTSWCTVGLTVVAHGRRLAAAGNRHGPRRLFFIL
jgi:hypothetical protein